MQETELYTALLAELTDEQFAQVVIEEVRRRGCSGILYMTPCGSREPGFCAVAMTDEMREFAPRPEEQLRLFAAHASICSDGVGGDDCWAV